MFFFHPNSPQLNGPACGPVEPLCWLPRKSWIEVSTPTAHEDRAGCFQVPLLALQSPFPCGGRLISCVAPEGYNKISLEKEKGSRRRKRGSGERGREENYTYNLILICLGSGKGQGEEQGGGQGEERVSCEEKG